MPDIVKAAPIELCRETPTSAAIQQIIAACLAHAKANTASIGSAEDPDAVHQTRVGLRRTRSALSLFKDQVVKSSRKQWNADLRTLGAALAPSRDWDVFVTQTVPKAHKQINNLDCEEILHLAAVKRRDAYGTLCDQLPWQAVFKSLTMLPLRNKQDVNEPIEDLAPELLIRQAQRVRRCGRHLDTPEQRHAMRKAMKRLRYGVEFLASLYGHKSVRTYLDHCKSLQGVLGDMNDASTTVRLCTELATPMTAPLIAWAQHQETKAGKHLAEAIRDLRTVKPFWY